MTQNTGESARMPKKKLIEVALPLEAINAGCGTDKNRKTGHIRNLHKWFAPMPLPAWRALLFATLVDDPGEHLSEPMASTERARLLGLVEALSAFDSHKNSSLLAEVRREIAHAVGDTPPTVVDFFCGGGSTVLEAQRLGLATRASDLNPVPVIITTVLCRVAPLFSRSTPVHPGAPSAPIGGWHGLEGFVSDVNHYAQKVRDLAWADLKSLYPPMQGRTPHAYRWTWTVHSPDPSAQNLRTPLVANWWLSRHKSCQAWVEPIATRDGLSFAIQTHGAPPAGSVGKRGAVCLYSRTPIPLEYIRSEGRAQRLAPCMFAVATRAAGNTAYYAPDGAQVAAANAAPQLTSPGIDLPDAALGFRVQQYGLTDFHQLFLPRQAHALSVFAHHVSDLHDTIRADALAAGRCADGRSLEDGGQGADAYADAVLAMLALCVSKMAQSNCILVRWFVDPRNGSGKATPAFDRHAVPMVWDFVETNPFGGSVGDWTGPVLETALRALQLCADDAPPAEVAQMDARVAAEHLPANALIATDPPYYANIGYADLSDFFYLWLRKALRRRFPRLLATVGTPKTEELIATPHRHDGSAERSNDYFRQGFRAVFERAARKSDPRFPILIVYAIKQTENTDEDAVRSTGWDVLLSGLIDAEMQIVATWPVRTTTDTRMIGIGTNALASAIFVICRQRRTDASRISRAQFLRELQEAVPPAIARLKEVNIAPVDMAQAAIGPGMAVFSRYSEVLDTAGGALGVGDALTLINQTLDRCLAEQDADFDADSRWALAWFEYAGFADGEYGVAETLSKAKNTSVQGLKEAGILDKKAPGGKVRLLRPEELPADWDPATDPRLTAWEIVHHLIRVLGDGGESGAAELVAKLNGRAENARELAYRLYSICERRKRAQEALSYNALVQSWPEIARLAKEPARAPTRQAGLFGEED